MQDKAKGKNGEGRGTMLKARGMVGRGHVLHAASRHLAFCILPFAFCIAALAVAAQERGPAEIAHETLLAAIDRLGDLDYDTRMTAARTVRRTESRQAVPALVDAFEAHGDGYVRFKALVLLTGFPDPRTHDAMLAALVSPHDRLREVAYGYFEHHADSSMVPRLLEALEQEQGEFVRPALVRALAAWEDDPRVRAALLRDVMRGVDFFRSTVIEALGDYKWAHAIDPLTEVANLDGPLQVDAVIALGKIGDKRSLETLAALQRTAVREHQPSIAAAICLLGVNCSSHLGYLRRTLEFADRNPGYQELLRGAASGLGAIAASGNADALHALFAIGIPSQQEPVRAPIALALGMVALRNTPLMLAELERHPAQGDAVGLLAEGFDMLEEHLEEERFFVEVRRTYWAAPEGSPTRALCEQLISKLDF
jgi:HEAT repeat protein